MSLVSRQDWKIQYNTDGGTVWNGSASLNYNKVGQMPILISIKTRESFKRSLAEAESELLFMVNLFTEALEDTKL